MRPCRCRDKCVIQFRQSTFQLKQAGYTPMVSDGERLFLVGYYDLIGLEPARR
jgi:hypothetical protein